jgi:hypothetical protein
MKNRVLLKRNHEVAASYNPRKELFMVGIPSVLATRQDWLNTYQYVQGKDDAVLKTRLRERFEALKNTRFMRVPKADAVPSVPEGSPEGTEPQIQPEDFEEALDPASSFVKSGLVIDEIDQFIGALNGTGN